MKGFLSFLELMRYAAAGGMLASALANIALSPTHVQNVVAAIVGAVLAGVFVKSRHMV